MNQTKTSRIYNILFVSLILAFMINGLEACSNKSKASKSATTALSSEPAVKEPTPPPPPAVEEKEGMQIKRDASGNFIIQLLLKDLQPVKLMKPVKEGYVVWMVNEANVKSVTCYDPSAGSGTLLMNIAHAIGEKNCRIYSEDISQKSSNDRPTKTFEGHRST